MFLPPVSEHVHAPLCVCSCSRERIFIARLLLNPSAASHVRKIWRSRDGDCCWRCAAGLWCDLWLTSVSITMRDSYLSLLRNSIKIHPNEYIVETRKEAKAADGKWQAHCHTRHSFTLAGERWEHKQIWIFNKKPSQGERWEADANRRSRIKSIERREPKKAIKKRTSEELLIIETVLWTTEKFRSKAHESKKKFVFMKLNS